MARLKGKKGIDKGAVVDVPDDQVEEYLKSGDYEEADQELADAPQEFGVLQQWDANEDYSLLGRREAGLE